MPGFFVMIEALAEWLENPVYEAGVLLYEKLFGPGFMTDFLKKGCNDYRREQLTTALQQEYDSLQQQQQEQKERYPQSLKDDLSLGGRLMDERIALKERMRTLADLGETQSEELKRMAFRIIAIKDELDAIYGRQQFFDQNGYLPDPVTPSDTTPDQLLTRRNTLRTYVSRLTKQLSESYGIDEQQKLQERLQKYQTELFDVETLLTHAVQHP